MADAPLEKRPRTAESNVRDIRGGGRDRGGRPATGPGYDPQQRREVHGPTFDDPDEGYDPLRLHDSGHGYRPDRFYTYSVDAKGHGDRMTVRMPQGLDALIHAAVRAVPQYKGTASFFRDAAVHRLEWIQNNYEIDDRARRMLELERMKADTDAAMLEVEELKDSVEQLRLALERHYSSEDWQMFANELIRGDERLDWLREPYRGQTLKVLQDWRMRGAVYLLKLEEDRDDG